MKKGEEYKCGTMEIVLSIPEDAYKLSVTATVPIDGEPREVMSKLDLKEILERRKDFLYLCPEDDLYALYSLNPEYKAFLEECKQKGISQHQAFDMWDGKVREERRNESME